MHPPHPTRGSSRSPPTTSTGKTRSGSRSKRAPRSRPTRSPAWKPRCDSAGRRRSRARSSRGSPPGRTGSSSGPNAVGPKGALQVLRQRAAQGIRPQESVMAGIDYISKIPNNVDLASNRRLQRALEDWQPKFLEWWKDMGPDGLPGEGRRTCARRSSVDAQGWAQFGYVKMPEYRWGIFLAEPEADRRISFGESQGTAGVAGGARRASRNAATAHRHAGRHRAGVGRAAAAPRPARARRSTTSATSSR